MRSDLRPCPHGRAAFFGVGAFLLRPLAHDTPLLFRPLLS
jgi:hypothetical protein